MRKIITTTFITLDGVMQSPGGADEDRSDGFSYGGWQFGNYHDDVSGKILQQHMDVPFEMLLGRQTYDIFAAYWPLQNDDGPFSKPFNKARKYVVSHNAITLTWQNSKLVTGNIVEEIKKLKALDAPDLWVWGSGNLIQTLLSNTLIDQMHIWTFPLTLGTGKKLFAQGTQPQRFNLQNSVTTTTGVTIATYEVAETINHS